MISAEEWVGAFNMIRINADMDSIDEQFRVMQEQVTMIKQDRLESRIAGLREAYSLSLNRVKVLDRIAELEKELKP